MENSDKVFASNITRVGSNPKNNLYDLLNVVPATPLQLKDIKINTCDYSPKTDKYYIPKRKSRLKVKTIRDIRKSFEQDTYSYLFTDLETQQNILFKKIRRGSSRDDNTKKLAKKILRGDAPISRSTWQMLINLNPEQHKHPRQFALWNGKYIQVNGSYGGIKKNICNYDLASKKLPSQNHKKKCLKHIEGNGKKGLLRNSLAVKFKPGPLCKKQFLDISHQKYHVGNVELINLPKPGLDIQPKYGVAFESTVTHFLNNLRHEDGTMSQKWAELAVSVLGTVEQSKAVQLNRDCITFDLPYKYNQNRLLMRRDVGNCFKTSELIDTGMMYTNTRTVGIDVQLEIEEMVNKIIDAVEINLIQDKIFTQEQELKPFLSEDLNSVNTVAHLKDKSKRKFCELDRLDVTVITLPETEERSLNRSCGKMHCSFGCICASLEGTYNLKRHCGRVECMFDCKCGFSKYKNDFLYTECSDLFPGLLNIDSKMNLNLAKEEQKFHQTVIVSGEKRILLKGEKRNWKTPKKYADFYSNMTLKHENQKKQDFSIVALKLNCDNIAPWCMVHKLYKCFCKGKFTETCASVSNETVVKESLSTDCRSNVECLEENSKVTNENSNVEECEILERANSVRKTKIPDNLHKKPTKIHKSKSLDKSANANNITENVTFSAPENENQINRISVKDADNASAPEIINYDVEKGMITRHAVRKFNMQQNSSRDNKKPEKISDSECSDYLDYLDCLNNTSSRTSPYEGRKYSDGYYKNTNYKIRTMEKNDKRLQERLAFLYRKNFEDDTIVKPTIKTKNDATNLLELLCDNSKNSEDLLPKSKRKRLSNETKLVAWLESNYKMYKQRNDQGLFKNALQAPQHGRVALHSWDFILKRYRERKNLFLVSRQKPFRIFMAVDAESPFFENCIDINDIRFADLHKYPQTVKNLLINATDLKDNFCILRGLSCCWELIGSVTKVNDNDEHGTEHKDTPEINIDSSNVDNLAVFDQNDSVVINSLAENMEQKDLQSQSITEKEFEFNTACSEDAGSSKWFVMTIENDFSEIRFFRKGFFVKYGSIINAISVARLSGKTVRLSSKKCIEQPEAPQFGIYAIPNDNEYCVFVGPYEMEDTLGIETIKTILDVRRLKRTRGFWITTNKVDNLKVVENPLSFVPSTNSHTNNAMPLETHFDANDDINKNQQETSQESSHSNKIEESKEGSPSKKGIKIVKPIKIRKTNGFYHLASDGILKKISLQYPQSASKAMPAVINTCLYIEDDDSRSLLKPNTVSNELQLNPVTETSQEPITEAASQIKISAVFSTQNDDLVAKSANHDRGMFILKPEEINRKVIQNKCIEMTSASMDEYNINDGTQNCSLLESDLEYFAAESTEWCPLQDDIYVISDDENYTTSSSTENCNIWTNVWIQCTNIPDLGWIAGIKNLGNLLSFKFPGCEYSEFYTEEEAYTKINLELFERINGSSDLKPQWKVIESTDQLQGQEMNPEHLYSDYILTQEGLLHTSDIIKSNKDNLKTYSKIQQDGKDRGSRSTREMDKVELLLHENDENSRIQEE